MDEELDIVVTGFDVDHHRAVSGLCRLFGLDAARARRFVDSVPMVVRHAITRASAERYLHALQSIGARVELRPAARPEDGEAAAAAVTSSLPIPAPSVIAGLDQAIRVERETLNAIRRFRAAEGLDEDTWRPLGRDPHNPEIPRPPAVPHDLARMPNAKRGWMRERPAWMLTDPLAQGEASADRGESARAHADAELPPPPPSAGARGSVRASSSPQARAATARATESTRPRAVGLAHAATASVRPGLGLLSFWQSGNTTAPRRLRYLLLAAAVLLLAAVCAYLWLGQAPAVRR